MERKKKRKGKRKIDMVLWAMGQGKQTALHHHKYVRTVHWRLKGILGGE